MASAPCHATRKFTPSNAMAGSATYGPSPSPMAGTSMTVPARSTRAATIPRSKSFHAVRYTDPPYATVGRNPDRGVGTG
jgi:hypothetical protein